MGRVTSGPSTIRRAVAAILVGFAVLLVACGCGSASGEGFALYLPATEIPPAQLATLSHIEIADAPLLSSADIASYSADTHEIELTAAAYGRIVDLVVPVSGRVFVVCVDRQPVYAGAFWTPISSMSFDGVVIMQPLAPETAADGYMLRLELGYPGPDFFSGEDPRAASEVVESLEQADKLR